MPDEISGQLGSAALGNWGLGWPGPQSLQQANIKFFTASTLGPVVPATSVTLAWSTALATTVSISPGIGSVSGSGTTTVNPASTTTYVLTATDGVNPPQTLSLTVVITNIGTFVRSAKATSQGTGISLGMQLDLGDLVVVCIADTQIPDNPIAGVTDSLGNVYQVAIQGNHLPPDSATADDSLMAWTIVTKPGVATISAAYPNPRPRLMFALEYIAPLGMTLAQTAHTLGGFATTPSYNSTSGFGTVPYNVANSIVVTFYKSASWGFCFTSLDGDTMRQSDPGCDFGAGPGRVCGAVFDAFTGSPGIRNSKVKMDPFTAPGAPCGAFPPFDCNGAPWPTAPFYGFGGNDNVLVAVFSAPLPRSSTLTDQGAVRPGVSGTVSGYAGQPDVPISLPYLPRIGFPVFVGCSAEWVGGSGPKSNFTVTDAYGNIYTAVTGSRYQLGFNVAQMFYAVVAHLPAKGVFTVNVNCSVFNGQKCMSISEHDVNAFDPTMLAAAVQQTLSTGTGQQLLTTASFSVTARSLIAGFGTAQRTTSASTPWIQAGSFAIEQGASWDKGQVDLSPLPNSPKQGTGDWFHQYVASAGTYFGETITDGGSIALSDSAIIVVYVPAPLVPVGGALTLACPVNGGTAIVGLFYSRAIVVTGGVPPYSNFHVIAGSLPPGLTLDRATGVISGIPTTPGTYTFTIEATDSTGATARITCTIVVPATASTFMLIYPVNYRELDTASQIASAGPIHTSYTGRLIATDHTRKWTRWNAPAVGGALMYRQPGKIEPVFFIGGNVYALRADLLTDDDLGLIVPYYTTYFFVTHDAEMGLTYVDATGERQPLGSGRKLLAYLKAYIAAQNTQAPGTCQLVVTPFVDNLQNPWALIGLRTLVNKPKFDLEWPGGQVQGDRIALKFASIPITGTDNGFSLQRLTAFLKRTQRLQIRGAN